MRLTTRQLRTALERLIETVMLRPGGRDASRLLVTLRFFIVGAAVLGLLTGARVWAHALDPGFLLEMVAIDAITLIVTVVLSVAAGRAEPRTLRAIIILTFASDLALELLGLMASGHTNGIFFVIPFLSLMSTAIIAGTRPAGLLALLFAAAYLGAAVLVRHGAWPLASDLAWVGNKGASDGQLVLYLGIQVFFLGLVLAPFLLLIERLRALYRDFAAQLETAVRRIEAEVVGRDEAQAALRERERYYQLLADNVTDMVAVCAPSLDHTFVSPSARTVIGHAPAELLGRSLSAIIHPEDWPGVARVLAKHAHEPSGTAGELLCEYRARHRDGRWVWLETRGRTVSGPDGPGGLILSTRDVTKRRELEASMLQAQKLESLGLLAGGVAHDFNNILMAIMGNAEVSAHALPPSSPLHEHLTTIVSSSERAADLCKQMMTYAGRSGSTLTRVQLNDVLRDIHALVGAAVPAKARLGYALGEVLPPIDADPAQLRQIAMNLVINAAEAIGDRGGDVRIASGTLAFETPFDVGPQENHLQLFAARPQGQHVYLRISDDGSGMDQATLERIFDPFFTTKFTGRGLGLSAVVGIVYHHRGFIRVTTQPGHGTTFTVAFPVAVRAAVPEPAVAPAPVRAAWRGAGLCLVVDDDGDVLDITREMLTSMGFSVITATDGAYALDVFRRRSREVAFVICDVAMPRMDGGELVQALRAIRPDVTIAIMTGFAEADMRERFAPLQVARVIQKPFSYDELLKAARALLAAAGGAGGSDAADPTDAASGAPASGTIGRPNAPN